MTPKSYWRSAIIFSRSFRQSDSCPPDVFWYSAIRAGDTEPRKVAFRYKLEDRDKTWEDAGARRQAFYNDLPPGRYRFRVIASNNDGVWNEEGATLTFSIAPDLNKRLKGGEYPMNSNVPMSNQKRKEIDNADEELLVESTKEGDEQAFAHYGGGLRRVTRRHYE